MSNQLSQSIIFILICINVSLSAKAQIVEKPSEDDQLNIYTSPKFSLDFSQKNISNNIENIGFSRYASNALTFTKGNFSLELGAGFLAQASSYDLLNQSLQVGADFTAEYFISQHWSVFASGKYFSNDLNNNTNLQNPIFYDPSFMQSGFDAGVKGDYGDFNILIGGKRTIPNTPNLDASSFLYSSFSLKF